MDRDAFEAVAKRVALDGFGSTKCRKTADGRVPVLAILATYDVFWEHESLRLGVEDPGAAEGPAVLKAVRGRVSGDHSEADIRPGNGTRSSL